MVDTQKLELISKTNRHQSFFSQTQPFGHRAEGGIPLLTAASMWDLFFATSDRILGPLGTPGPPWGTSLALLDPGCGKERFERLGLDPIFS